MQKVLPQRSLSGMVNETPILAVQVVMPSSCERHTLRGRFDDLEYTSMHANAI